MKEQAVLATHNLTIGYAHKGHRKIVAKEININLSQGRLTCLMGPNGIGKSTLIKTITGIQPPLSGEVLVNGNDLQTLSRLEKAQKLSVVLTDRPMSGYMTVRDLISLGRYPYTNWQNNLTNYDQSIINQAINAVGIIALADTPLTELSDGNFQKAIIGRALAQDTEIIILDEPTIHLDVNNKNIIIKLLRVLCQEHNKTILLSTHDLTLAMHNADNLWLFSNSQIITGLPEDLAMNGTIERVFSETGTERTQEVLARNITVTGDLEAVALLKQALAKANIPDNKNLNKIEINRFDNRCTILHQQQEYNSIEEFIYSISTFEA